MAELADMLKNILDDPSTVDKLKGMLGGADTAPSVPDLGIDPKMLMRVTQAMKSDSSDNRTRLLRDLKPYISPRRQQRVDEAINILRILRIAELVKNEEEGR